MPTYSFKCQNQQCEWFDKDFDAMQCLNDNHKHANCPFCNEKAIRVFTAPLVQFIGAGFHVNDYNTHGRK